jgi:hypothetical protein
MGKMKALLIDKEETEEDNQEFDVVMEEMHYVNTIQALVSLIEVYGWHKVTSDLRVAMGNKSW